VSLWLLLLPDEFIPVLILGICIAVMLGVFRVGSALAFISSIAIIYLLSPFAENLIMGLIDSLDLWILIVLMIFFGFYIMRLVLTPILGSEAVGVFIGHAFYDFVLLPFRILGSLIRLLVLWGTSRVR